jgi:hypothetical protein
VPPPPPPVAVVVPPVSRRARAYLCLSRDGGEGPTWGSRQMACRRRQVALARYKLGMSSQLTSRSSSSSGRAASAPSAAGAGAALLASSASVTGGPGPGIAATLPPPPSGRHRGRNVPSQSDRRRGTVMTVVAAVAWTAAGRGAAGGSIGTQTNALASSSRASRSVCRPTRTTAGGRGRARAHAYHCPPSKHPYAHACEHVTVWRLGGCVLRTTV